MKVGFSLGIPYVTPTCVHIFLLYFYVFFILKAENLTSNVTL